MNILFSLGMGALTGAAFFAISCIVIAVVPGKKARRVKIAAVIAAVIALLQGATSIAPYGPRGEVQQAASAPIPERRASETSAPLVEPSDRLGQFDEKLTNKPLEIDQ